MSWPEHLTAMSWPEHLSVAVNLSPAQFASGSIEEAVVNALSESGLGPNRLELEITETLLLSNTDATMAILKKLKAIGVSIVMDDFGTGYSSLSYLWKFPFDKIKIDRSFKTSVVYRTNVSPDTCYTNNSWKRYPV